MKFSIIVPIYNVSKYLRECIESVINQTYQNYELILVNDGSKDNSLEICNEYAYKFNKITIINKENGGLTSARKAGCEIARGDYVICLDGDDFLNLDYLEICSNLIDEFKPDCLCFGYNTYKDGSIISYQFNDVEPGFYSDTNDLNTIRNKLIYDFSKSGFNNGSTLYSIWSKAVKRELYSICQMKIDNSVSYGEDLLLTTMIINNANSIYYSEYISYNYRLLNSSMSHKYNSSIINKLNLIKQILEIELGEDDRISIYLYTQLIGQIRNAALSLNFKEFKKELKNLYSQYPNLVKAAKKAKLNSVGGFERIRKFIFSHKMSSIIFLFYRISK